MVNKSEILEELLSAACMNAAEMNHKTALMGNDDMREGLRYIFSQGMSEGYKKGHKSGVILGVAVSAATVGLTVTGYKLKEYYDIKKMYKLEQEKIRQTMNNNVKQKAVVVSQSDVQEELNKPC